MAEKPIDWSLYRSFLAVMREGSLSGAARALGMTQPSIGRHIHALETVLDVRLFTRAQDGLRPTPTALELLPAAQSMAAAVQQAERVVAGAEKEERGVVRLAASLIVGIEVLPALLAAYRERHPLITIELAVSNRMENLLRREADIAVRMVRPTQKALYAKSLGKVAIGFYAHQSYVRSRGLPNSLAELSQHDLIGYDQDVVMQQLVRQFGLDLPRGDLSFRADNDLAQLAALRAGLGIGGCQTGIARRDPALVPVLADQLRLRLDMWLVTHPDLRSNRRVMGLFKFLAGELAQYAQSSGEQF